MGGPPENRLGYFTKIVVILVIIEIFIFISTYGQSSSWLPISIPSFIYNANNTSSSNNKNETNINQDSTMNQKPRILFWTSLYARSNLSGFCLNEMGLKRQSNICKYTCDFTTDKSLVESSHAIVFHARDLQVVNTNQVDLPRTRKSSQSWIFFMIESQIYTWANLKLVENIFNWTMTFRRDSDIYIPYGNLVKKIDGTNYNVDDESPFVHQPHRTFEYSINELKNKTKLVAWIVSNCDFQQSGRNQFVLGLQKYLTVDLYGKCGKKKCPKLNTDLCDNPLECYHEISKEYKFYLALENSLCEDYLTEKFFNALLTNLVPVVNGHVNYSMHAPPGSFININDFASTKELADHLLYLDKNMSAYLEYFEWKKNYFVQDIFYLDRAWCSLCAKLWFTSYESKLLQQEANNNTNNVVKLIPNDTNINLSVNFSRSVQNLSYWWYSRNKAGYTVCVEPSIKWVRSTT